MLMQYSDPIDAGPGLAPDARTWSRRAGSVMVMFTLMLPFVLVPMVGLAIDGTMMYSVKAKLQAAVDGGAIAAAQTLNSGMTFAVQKATAEKTARQFIRANIVVGGTGSSGYWGAYNLNDTNCDSNGQPVTGGASPCVVAAEDNANKRRTVQVNASVQVPLLFMRILGFSTGTVTAKGTAARRDVVMVLVLDRSSSMDHVINGVNVRDAMKAGAAYFVSQFQSTRDRLGLIVFGGSTIIAYPSADWRKPVAAGGNSLTGAAGPDTHFKDTPDSAGTPNILTSISNVQVFSNTGTAEALWLAYLELKAANQPGALNAIVLFTDGLPNGITANFNNTATTVIKSGSHCINKKDNGNSTLSMLGWMAQWGGFVSGGSADGHGIFSLAQTTVTSTQSSVTNWLIHGTEPTIASPPSQGCDYALPLSSGPPPTTHTEKVSNDLTIPTVDLYGNSTLGSNSSPYTGLDYQQSEIWGNECTIGSRIATLNVAALAKSNDACVIGLASWNAADMAGMRIRADATLKPVIYSMGFRGNGGDDPALMRRLSNINVASNTVYDSSKPQGMYIPIQVPNDIAPAFQYVLSEILRLTL